jgi:CRP-like cAMP-binding protein
MFELLHKKIDAIISLNEDELNYCKTLFLPKKLRKRQYLLQEGDVCKYQAFVEKGMLRSYLIDEREPNTFCGCYGRMVVTDFKDYHDG